MIRKFVDLEYQNIHTISNSPNHIPSTHIPTHSIKINPPDSPHIPRITAGRHKQKPATQPDFIKKFSAGISHKKTGPPLRFSSGGASRIAAALFCTGWMVLGFCERWWGLIGNFPVGRSYLCTLRRQPFPCSPHCTFKFLFKHLAGREIGKIFRDVDP